MERPQAEIQREPRSVTGEIVYLNEMRRRSAEPKPYSDLGDMAIQMYETEADMFKANGIRPNIMDEYERYDSQPGEAVASCLALADALLKLKESNSPLTFVDIAVDKSAGEVLASLKATMAGSLLTKGDEQLAIQSDGDYYPVLDIQKQNARLSGVGVRVWGWDDEKYIFTNQAGQPFNYPQDVLTFPSNETASRRQIELMFGYTSQDAGQVTESISLYLSANGSAHFSRNICVAAYAETGYEGHHGQQLYELTDDDIAAYGDLIAEIVGDVPESIHMRVDRQLHELTDNAATPVARQAIQNLIDATWPAQANYLLSLKPKGSGRTLAEQLADESSAVAAAATVDQIIQKWQQPK